MSTQAPPPVTAPAQRSDLDRLMRKILFLPTDAPLASRQEAQKAFQTSLVVASVRCLLMYIFFPFVLPLIGVTTGVGPWIGVPISILAIITVTMSIRRFWRSDHSKRWHYTVIGVTVIGFMCYLLVRDISTIFA